MTSAPLALSLPLAAVLLLLALPALITASRGWRAELTRENRLGLHTPAAVASEDAFQLANRVAAPLVAGAGAVALVTAGLTVLLPLGVAGALVVAILGFIGYFWQMASASRLGERAAMTVPRPARKPQGGCCGAGGACGCGAGAHGGAGAAGADIPDLVADATTR